MNSHFANGLVSAKYLFSKVKAKITVANKGMIWKYKLIDVSLLWIVSENPVTGKVECIGAIKNNVVITEIVVKTIIEIIVQRGKLFGLNQYKAIDENSKSPAGI